MLECSRTYCYTIENAHTDISRYTYSRMRLFMLCLPREQLSAQLHFWRCGEVGGDEAAGVRLRMVTGLWKRLI